MFIADNLDRYGFEDNLAEHYSLMIRNYVSIYSDEEDEVPLDRVCIKTVYHTQDGQLTTTPSPVYTKVLIPETLTNPANYDEVMKTFFSLNIKGYLGLLAHPTGLPIVTTLHKRFYSQQPLATMPISWEETGTEEGNTTTEMLYIFKKANNPLPIARAVNQGLYGGK